MARMDPTRRFSGRAADYDRFRPTYPAALIDLLVGHGLAPDHVLADLGAGTGILTRLFLAHDYRVIAIEPNADMAAVATARLGQDARFSLLDARAEATGLADASVDAAVAGTAFHWFDHAATRRELLRILRPPRLIALASNERRNDASAFMAGFDALCREFGTDYADLKELPIPVDGIRLVFGGVLPDPITLQNHQDLDLDGLLGRLGSMSYLPGRGQPRFAELTGAATDLFRTHACAGKVRIEYDTIVYCGALRD